jgi:hypothetical protein
MDEDVVELPVDRTVIDYLIVADYAEVVSGKTYLMGGGWDKFGPPGYPAQMRLGIAVGIRVPYLEANQAHHFIVALTKGDGGELFKLEGDVETGRAPGSRGDSTLVPFAANIITTLEGPQLLELVARVGSSVQRMSIRAIEPPGPALHRG